VSSDDVYAQTVQLLRNFEALLQIVDSDLDHIVHIKVFLADFDRMNEAYISVIKTHRPARTVIASKELPKPTFKVLINLTAVTADA